MRRVSTKHLAGALLAPLSHDEVDNQREAVVSMAGRWRGQLTRRRLSQQSSPLRRFPCIRKFSPLYEEPTSGDGTVTHEITHWSPGSCHSTRNTEYRSV